MNVYLVSFFALVHLEFSFGAVRLQEQYKWKVLDYAFSSDAERSEAIHSGKFIPGNNLPVGIEVWKDKLFVTVPRWKPGVPSTLNYIPLTEHTPPSPALVPYPNWEANEFGNCDVGLTNVYRIKADSCDRLWVLDTGTFGIGNTSTQVCPYTLNIIDLHTGKFLRKYLLRAEDLRPTTFIANIAIDEGPTCENTVAYMSDELGYGLIAYSWEHNHSWRFGHPFFTPDPLGGDFHIGGLNFQWSEEGIFGMSLSPVQADGYRTLFFSPLASTRLFAVSTRILRDPSKVEANYHDFHVLPDRGPNGHITAQAMDEHHGIQFFNLIDINAVGCWNTKHPYHPGYIGVVDKDDKGLIFPSDVKVDDQKNVWIISDRMPVFLLSSLDYNDVNFRVYFAPIEVLIKGTACDHKGHHDIFGPNVDEHFGIPFFGNKNLIF